MTQAEFLAYCKIYPSQVNVWYTDTAPYTIQGMSVPVLDLNLDDNTPFLTQVEKVTIPLPGGGTVTLDITQISITTVNTVGQGATSFFFLLTTPSILTGTLTSNVIAGNLSFSPSINGVIFNASPYNTIGGVVQSSRTSEYIMESDRKTIGIPGNNSYTGPTNISQLLSYSASKADIQDSNYSDTGWINGRYNGTKTNTDDSLVSPAVNGRLFEAAVFPLATALSQIQFQQTASQITYKDYFYTGVGDIPGFNEDNSNFQTQGSFTQYDRVVRVDILSYITFLNPFEVGDLISFGTNAEVCRVLQIGRLNSTTLTLVLTRAVFGTAAPIADNEIVSKIQQVQIYQLSGNKLQGVPKGLVLVKETGELLRLDPLGYVVEIVAS
jgi:hypothetical protein